VRWERRLRARRVSITAWAETPTTDSSRTAPTPTSATHRTVWEPQGSTMRRVATAMLAMTAIPAPVRARPRRFGGILRDCSRSALKTAGYTATLAARATKAAISAMTPAATSLARFYLIHRRATPTKGALLLQLWGRLRRIWSLAFAWTEEWKSRPPRHPSKRATKRLRLPRKRSLSDLDRSAVRISPLAEAHRCIRRVRVDADARARPPSTRRRSCAETLATLLEQLGC
jgi:hypothetical protein